MATYKSVRSVDCSNPIILSFDVKTDDNLNLSISLIDAQTENVNVSLDINGNKSSGSYYQETIENNLSNHYPYETNTFQGEKIIIECEESQSGVISNGQLITTRPEISSNENGYITFDSNLSDLTNGSMIFFLTNEPESDNVIHSNLGTFEQIDEDAFQITPFVLGDNEYTDNEYYIPLILDITEDSMSFILLGHAVEKTYSQSPTTIYTSSYNGTSFKEFQRAKDTLKSPYRARFVISNNGRMLSFSKYNKSSMKWETIKNFIFNIDKITSPQKIKITTKSVLTNISANF